MASRKEGNCSFNDALNTFYLVIWHQAYGKGPQSERKPTAAAWATFRLAARVHLYAPSHRQDNTYHCLWYTSRGTLAVTRNSSMVPPWRIDQTTHCTMSKSSYHSTKSHSQTKGCFYKKILKKEQNNTIWMWIKN